MIKRPVMPGETCAHCGEPPEGYATIFYDVNVCHTDDPARPDCYRRITVYGERAGALIGARPLPCGITEAGLRA